ncbi:MAG: acyl-CoA thioesterase [Limisphaerales bacterium]
MATIAGSRFSSELQVRPDDIDMNQHVHASKYFDYVLAARFDQMARCYKMGMEEFLALGLGWFVRTSHIEYKRPLKMGDWFTVTTWIDEVEEQSVRVRFEITKKANNKIAADGYCFYTLVTVQTGRAQSIPAEVAAKYSI